MIQKSIYSSFLLPGWIIWNPKAQKRKHPGSMLCICLVLSCYSSRLRVLERHPGSDKEERETWSQKGSHQPEFEETHVLFWGCCHSSSKNALFFMIIFSFLNRLLAMSQEAPLPRLHGRSEVLAWKFISCYHSLPQYIQYSAVVVVGSWFESCNFHGCSSSSRLYR